MTLISKSYILSHGVKVLFVLSSGAVCIFSRTDRSWARLYRVYSKSAKSTAIEYTQEVLCGGNANLIFFQAIFFCMYYKQKWSSRRVVKIMCPCATSLGTYFPEGNLVSYILRSMYTSASAKSGALRAPHFFLFCLLGFAERRS